MVSVTRDAVCNGLECLGTRIDPERNNIRGKEQRISAEGSKVKNLRNPYKRRNHDRSRYSTITSALKK